MSDGSAIEAHLAAVRTGLGHRPGPDEIAAIVAAGGIVVDTRPVGLRESDGELPGAHVVDRNQLEWRLDPTSPHRIDAVTGADQVVVLVCDEGYASSLAADSLRRMGVGNATDLDGGFQAWRRWVAGTSD